MGPTRRGPTVFHNLVGILALCHSQRQLNRLVSSIKDLVGEGEEGEEVKEEEILAYLSRYGYLDDDADDNKRSDGINGTGEHNGLVLLMASADPEKNRVAESAAAAEPAAAEDNAVAEASPSVADGEVRSHASGAGEGRSGLFPHQVSRI